MDDITSQDQPQVEVQEGEIVAADLETSTPTTDASGAMVLESLESLIRENLAKIDKLAQDANQHKEMIDSVLGNDETYKLHDEEAKKAAKTKTATKQEIMKRPDVAHVVTKLKEVTAEIKEIKESMSSYLQEYQRLSGSNEIEDQNGEPRQIVYQARLVKRA